MLGCRNIWKLANSTVIRNWKKLFVSGYKYNSPIYTMMDFSNLSRADEHINVL
jgi:hypothetical protein